MAGHISEAELKRRMAKMGSFVEKPKKGGGSTIPPDKKVSKPPSPPKPKKNFLEKLRSRFQAKKLKQIEQATGQSTEDLKRGFKLKP